MSGTLSKSDVAEQAKGLYNPGGRVAALSPIDVTGDITTTLGLSKVGGVTTQANSFGTPIVVQAGRQNRTNQAPLTITYTPPAVAGCYRISLWLDVTTGTAISFKINLTYKDASGTGQTDYPIWALENSATMLVNPTSNTADRFYIIPYTFAIDNSATNIVIADNSGTYTTCAYRYQNVIEWLYNA